MSEDKNELAPIVKENSLVRDTEDDVSLARESIKGMIKISSESIEILAGLARDAESPRVFEILDNAIANHAKLASELIKLQKIRKDITKDEKMLPQNQGGGNQTTNAVFVGSTQEFQQMLKEKQAEEASTIDIEQDD